MKPIKPKTQPDKKMLRRINAATNDLFSCFTPAFLSDKTGISRPVVTLHKFRKKLSVQAATKYCKIAEVKAAGFTREMLRPDVINWYGDE